MQKKGIQWYIAIGYFLFERLQERRGGIIIEVIGYGRSEDQKEK